MIILVADDDRLVRFTIKSILQEILGDNGDTFLEAENGKDMLALCRERMPDVAFVDIRMPYMNGLKAIEESKKYSEATEYVIVSGYSDFAYAQKGISLGIHEYILKPVDKEQLKQIMGKLQEKVKNQNYESNSRFQLRLMNTFNEYAAIGLESYEAAPDRKYHYLAFLLYMSMGRAAKEESVRMQKQLLQKLRELGDEVVNKKGYYVITNTVDGIPCILFGLSELLEDYVFTHIKKIMMISAQKFKGNSICHMQWFRAETEEEVCKMCDCAGAKMYLMMQEHSGSLHEYDSCRTGLYEQEFLRQVGQLLEAWEQADGIVCREVMNKLWRTYQKKEPDVNLENVSAYCSLLTGCRIDSSSLKGFCKSFVDQVEQMYEGMHREDSDVMEQIKGYIQRYYMNDISISQIAEHFSLTANYLSTIFHRKAGVRFIDYLTDTRIEAAKKLLLSNVSASVQDIAIMVGYNSARHFSALFQKQTGETPSDYRKSRI